VADNQEISVKISADVKSLLQGLKDAQEHTETAAAGIKGDLGSLIESFEKFGAASLAIGAVGLAFEGLKEAVGSITEAVKETNELTESVEALNKRTGASFEDIAVYKNALMLTGGTLSDLSGIMNGLQRKMASNPEIFIANKIAANEMDLAHQDLLVTLAKSVKLIASIEEPGRKSEVSIALLGGRALAILPQLEKMSEKIEKMGPGALKELGAHIDQDAIAKLDKFNVETGTLKGELEKMDQQLAESGRSWATLSQKIELAWKNFYKFATERRGPLKTIEEIDKELGFTEAVPLSDAPKYKKDDEKGKEGDGFQGVTEADLAEQKKAQEAAKKAAEDRIAIAKMAQDEIVRSAAMSVQEQIKDDKELVASGQMSYADMVSDVKMAYKHQLDTAIEAMEKERNLLAGKPVEQAAILNKEKELQQKYYADLNDLDRQSAENTRKEKEKAHREEEKALRQQMELAKLAAQDELNLQKTILEEKDRALDQDLAFGRINEAQWVAMKKAGITQELRAQLDALDAEQKAAKDDLVAWTKIQNQKDALTRKAHLDMGKIEADALDRSRARWSSFFSSMTGGFDSAIQGLVKGTMTWGNAFKTVTDQALSGLISFFVQWGIEEATRWATSLAMDKTGNMNEAQSAAALYAVNAMASVAEIPMIGWAMAPGVGEAAYAEGLTMAGLASAEGGWDRVPQDTLAMIHKNEMVLPANLAENIRGMASGGDQKGEKRSVSITIQAMDGQDVHRVLTKHQDSLFRIFREGGRNGRI
jgi:hypothetical protein